MALNWSPFGMLRCPFSLRGLFVWLLLSLLLAGAASYAHGSRYAIVHGHGPYEPVAEQRLDPVPSQGDVAGAGNTFLLVSQMVRAVHEVGPVLETGAVQRCERRQCPRSEPAPLKTGVVDPPSLTRWQQPGDGILYGPCPPAPDLPALTVVELSISRT